MTDPHDFIDPDEGWPDLKPFFAHSEPCESCGNPVEERSPAPWAPDLMVGPCCAMHQEDIKGIPVTPELLEALQGCRTVQEVCDTWKAQRRKQPGQETQQAGKGRKAA